MKWPNYLYYVDSEIAQHAREQKVVDDRGYIADELCTCGAGESGWGAHAKSCLIYRYYVYGGIAADRILRIALKVG